MRIFCQLETSTICQLAPRLKKLGQSTITWFMNQKAPRKPLNMLFTSWMKYEKADLHAVVNTNYLHLSLPDQNKLLDLFTKYEDLFEGTLGDWNTQPVSFDLQDGAKLHHGRAYLVPHAHKETLRKELTRLCELGVLEWQPESELAFPPFIVPKKIKLCILSVILEK